MRKEGLNSMKMPNDDFLDPLRKRPNQLPTEEFEKKLQEQLSKRFSPRRTVSNWKYRLAIVAVLMLIIVLNPLEMLISEKEEEMNVGTKEELDVVPIYEVDNREDDISELFKIPQLKAMHDTLRSFGVPEESANIFVLYQFGLRTSDADLIHKTGFFSQYEEEAISTIIHYYDTNVHLSTLSVTNVTPSLGEPEFKVTAQFKNLEDELLEIDYILASNGELVFDPTKYNDSYFLLRRVIETNGVTITVPHFQGQINGVKYFNEAIGEHAITFSYDDYISMNADVTGTTIYDIDNVMSIEFHAEWSSEELAHPYARSTFLTLDLSHGRLLQLTDFVPEEELPLLEEKIKNILGEKEWLAHINLDEVIHIGKDHEFYLSTWDGTIILYFPRYEIINLELRVSSTLGLLP